MAFSNLYSFYALYPFREQFDHTAEKKTCDQPQWFKRNVGLFQFLVLLLLFSLCSLYRAIWAKYLERREKKMWMKVHTLRQFIDSESDKTERRAFYFHSKTKCTYHFNICFSSPYFGGIQHFILHKKKPFEKSAILIGTVWNVRVVVIPAKWSLWKIFLGKKITWYETKLQFSDLLA